VELLAQIHVADEVAAAVVGHTGPLGATLRDVEDYLANRVDRLGSRVPDVRAAYLDALGWSEHTVAHAVAGVA
jgi:c-di-GMP-related signal transduction protein